MDLGFQVGKENGTKFVQILIDFLSKIGPIIPESIEIWSKMGPNLVPNWSKIGLGPSWGPFLKNDEKWLPRSNYLRPLGGQVGGSWGPRWRI